MQGDPLASFWDAQNREANRWERLREIFEKLRLVIDKPSLRPHGVDAMLEQLQQRLDEAARLFPEPDWLAVDQERVEGVECYCGNYVGGMLEILGQALETLAEARIQEVDAADQDPGGPAE